MRQPTTLLTLLLLVSVLVLCSSLAEPVHSFNLIRSVKKFSSKVGQKVKSKLDKIKSAVSLDKSMESNDRHLKTICSRDLELASFLAKDSYDDKDSSGNDYKVVQFNKDKKTMTFSKIYFNEEKSTVVVAFRGTMKTSVRDWMNNLKIRKVKLSLNGKQLGKVHKGFLSTYLHDRKKIVSKVKQLIKEGKVKNLIFTGHSKGGATATLAALDFATSAIKKDGIQSKLITFGQPRTGNSDFAKKVDNFVPEYARVLSFFGNKKFDAVPIVPPKQLGYRHAGIDIQVKCGNKDRIKCHEITSYRLSISKL